MSDHQKHLPGGQLSENKRVKIKGVDPGQAAKMTGRTTKLTAANAKRGDRRRGSR
jgi:hypothetical protein